MNILPLLQRHLKDDSIIEVLEDLDAKVIYDFDRSHENIPDAYWAEAKDCGITMMFGADQKLDTVFIYMLPIEDHQPADSSSLGDVAVFSSVSEVEAYATDYGIPFRTGSRPAALQPPGNWIRLDYARHRVHYDFREGILHIITVSSANEPDAA